MIFATARVPAINPERAATLRATAEKTKSGDDS